MLAYLIICLSEPPGDRLTPPRLGVQHDELEGASPGASTGSPSIVYCRIASGQRTLLTLIGESLTAMKIQALTALGKKVEQ